MVESSVRPPSQMDGQTISEPKHKRACENSYQSTFKRNCSTNPYTTKAFIDSGIAEITYRMHLLSLEDGGNNTSYPLNFSLARIPAYFVTPPIFIFPNPNVQVVRPPVNGISASSLDIRNDTGDMQSVSLPGTVITKSMVHTAQDPTEVVNHSLQHRDKSVGVGYGESREKQSDLHRPASQASATQNRTSECLDRHEAKPCIAEYLLGLMSSIQPAPSRHPAETARAVTIDRDLLVAQIRAHEKPGPDDKTAMFTLRTVKSKLKHFEQLNRRETYFRQHEQWAIDQWAIDQRSYPLSEAFRFLDLPTEIRLEVYNLFDFNMNLEVNWENHTLALTRKSLRLVCHRISEEWDPMFFSTTTITMETSQNRSCSRHDLHPLLERAEFALFLKNACSNLLNNVQKVRYHRRLFGAMLEQDSWYLTSSLDNFVSLTELVIAQEGLVTIYDENLPWKSVWERVEDEERGLLKPGETKISLQRQLQGKHGILSGWSYTRRIHYEKHYAPNGTFLFTGITEAQVVLRKTPQLLETPWEDIICCPPRFGSSMTREGIIIFFGSAPQS